VIQADGDETALRPLTRFISGDDRPAQFCPFLKGKTPLERTAERARRMVSPERILYMLTRAHQPFFANQLADVPWSHYLVQEHNRGTLPAMLSSLVRIAYTDPDAVVAFFPCDHHFEQEDRFSESLIRAFEAADTSPASVILLGTTIRRGETSCGYIEPWSVFRPLREGWLRSIRRFWEKPAPLTAEHLVARGCLGNTNVMVGRASAFLELIESEAGSTYRAFRPMLETRSWRENAARLAHIYRRIRPSDFSKRVLASVDSRLAVLNSGDLGWSLLREPDRVRDLLSRSNRRFSSGVGLALTSGFGKTSTPLQNLQHRGSRLVM
jgi:mannose-1-phosphate guanylyltransferase